MPIYYVSKVLNGAEGRVRTNLHLKQTLGEPNTLGRLVKWAIKLSEYDISDLPRIAIKAYALADFILEMTGLPLEKTPSKEVWLLYVDGSTTTQGSGVGIVITSAQREGMKFAIIFDFKTSNNEAEYKVFVIGLMMAYEVGAQHLVAYSNSQHIVKQIDGMYRAKEENMV
ncbi:UNVERIFIED_CONTAM: hypothetical protein Slati_2385900 [Sesamum latifolium]|uniref:RNase H type-1 domain-containing protein n=1 Tax=Sesamum latifolium TaxID=2727402 RepID=A0AAW2WBF0_9LAMI